MNLKELNTINQLCKGIRPDNRYTIYKDRVLIFEPYFAIDNSKKIKEYTGYKEIKFNKIDINDVYEIQNGKELYTMIQSKPEFQIDDIHNIILKNAESTMIIPSMRQNENKDIDLYLEYIEKMKSYSLIQSYDINDYKDKILNTEVPFSLKLGDCKIRVTNKMLIGLKKDDELKCDIYEVDNMENIYVAIFTSTNKIYTIKHIYKFTNY